MHVNLTRSSWGFAVAVVYVALTLSNAEATEGYLQYGNGARQKGLGGAGVADSRDATSASLNPAGLVHVPDQVDMSLTVFSPWRSVTGASDTSGVVPQGTTESDRNLFLVPNFAWAKHVHGTVLFDVVGVTVYGNGGMNTSYAAGSPRPECGGASGLFCNGKAGFDLQQVFISVPFAKQVTPEISVGVAPMLARQQFKAFGLGAFAPYSLDSENLTNRGFDDSWGYGARGGIEWAVTSNIRLGVAGNTRIYMDELDKYRGLIAELGDFDVPASVQAGIAVDIRPDLTLMADYRFINYSDINAVASSSTKPAPLGNGPGFGWHDVNVFKIGLEWRATPASTYRIGYSHNSNPIKSADVMFNILAPGVVQDHFTAGAEFRLSESLSLELAGAYVPNASVKGYESALGNPAHGVEIEMEQYEFTVGFKYMTGNILEPLK